MASDGGSSSRSLMDKVLLKIHLHHPEVAIPVHPVAHPPLSMTPTMHTPMGSPHGDRRTASPAMNEHREHHYVQNHDPHQHAQQPHLVDNFLHSKLPVVTELQNPQSLADAGPLGLSAFGLTTVLLNLANTKAIGANGLPMIFAMGIFYGGLIQIIAGVCEFVRGRQFACVAFASYGAFWESLVFMHILPSVTGGTAVDEGSKAAFLFMWGIFTLGMFSASIRRRLPRVMHLLFFTLWILFWLLALGNIVIFKGHTHAGTVIIQIAGVEGVLVGLLAIYIAMAELNTWPLFPMKKTT